MSTILNGIFAVFTDSFRDRTRHSTLADDVPGRTEAPAPAPRYQIEGLTKVFPGPVVANDGIALNIGAGEVFGLLGSNGAGTSTLIKQMVGLLQPDRGTIVYDGHTVRPGAAALKRRVAYLAQHPLALLDLTVREAIVCTGRLRGLGPPHAALQADNLIEQLHLNDCADRVVAHLSGGQHRLVALASALIGDIETLVLDEPTNELDPEVRRRVWSLLKERCAETGATVVLVTHNALEAEQVLDRVAILRGGRLIACGTPGQIKRQMSPQLKVDLTFRQELNGTAPRLAALADMTQAAPNRVTLSAPRDQTRQLIERILSAVSLDDLDDFRIITSTLEDVYLQVATSGMGELPVGGES